MSKATLVILAAGMGSRYGGLKQIDTVGSNNESIIDFSIYDAIRAGFDKVVLIIRKEHEEAFRKQLTDRVSKKVEVTFAYQNLEDVPNGIKIPEGREKPWGTTHALLACKGIVDGPFMICNADDFYGPKSFELMFKFLTEEVKDSKYGMVGYPLVNTLTDNGTVTRGLCETKDNLLTDIVEIQKIRKNGEIAEYEENDKWVKASPDMLCSMNYWGFTPAIFDECEPLFSQYISENLAANPMKCEHVIPTAVGDLVKNETVSVKVMATDDKWFGVTYKDDKPNVVKNIQDYKDQGLYPEDLWK